MLAGFDLMLSKKLKNYEEIVSALTIGEAEKKMIITSWVDSIRLMELLTRRHHIRYNVLNLTTIVGSVLVPVIINLIPDPYAKITSSILGILVSISAGLSQSYRFNDRWKLFRKISEDLKVEGENFIALSGNYHSFNVHHDDAYKLFISNISYLKQNQVTEYFKKIEVIEHSATKKDELKSKT